MRANVRSLLSVTALLLGVSACDSSRAIAPSVPEASVSASASSAPKWTVLDLGAPPAYLQFGFSAISVSNIGSVVGQGRINGFTHGIVASPTGTYTTMRPLAEDVGTFAGMTNVLGTTIGISVVDRIYTNRVAVTWDRQGNPTPIPGLPRSDAEDAFLINDLGLVAGVTRKFSPNVSGFVWHRSWPEVRELQALVPGNPPLLADINNRGQIVGGIVDLANNLAPAIWDATGNVTALAPPAGARFSRPTSINDNGEIAGYSEPDDAPVFAWTWSKSRGYKVHLPPAGYTSMYFFGIDNAGRAYGVAYKSDGTPLRLMIIDGRIVPIPTINGGDWNFIVSHTGIMNGTLDVSGVVHPTIWIPRR